jgi:hypothetical protein
MVRLLDEALRRPRFGQHPGQAAPAVTVGNPAARSGTYGVRRNAGTVQGDERAGGAATRVSASTVDESLDHTSGGIQGRIRGASLFENELQTLAAWAVCSTPTK